MTVPNIINELARVTALAIELRARDNRDKVVSMTISEAEQLLDLWRNQQDDGK